MEVVIPEWVVSALQWGVSVIVSLGVPSAIVAFLLRRYEKKLDREREEKKAFEEQKEKEQKEFNLFLIKTTMASMSLSEATARAVQRIPDAKCNGDMTAALKYATDTKHQQKDFLTKLGVEHLYE